MRTLLGLATALSLAFTLATPTPTAEACGGYGTIARAPSAFFVSTHVLSHRATPRRAFVLLDGTVPNGLAWRRLAPSTFDNTLIAPGPARPAMTMTLVGPQGTRVVTSARYFYVKDMLERGAPTLALEIDALAHAAPEVALYGTPLATRWRAPTAKVPTPADAAWLESRGMRAADTRHPSVKSIDDVEVVTIYDSRQGQPVTFVRGGTSHDSRHVGQIDGTVVVGGTRYLALRHAGTIRLVAA